jgi:1-pyrroline-5-carboxylate dehydrogenase
MEANPSRAELSPDGRDSEAVHSAFDRGLEIARTWLGDTVLSQVDGHACSGGEVLETIAPHDGAIVIGRVHAAGGSAAANAVAAAARSFPWWSAVPWPERVTTLERVANKIAQCSSELAALVALEVGKTRLEAFGEVVETVELIRYYCRQMAANHGYHKELTGLPGREQAQSVLRPHGVWAVFSSFNYPVSLAAGPVCAALIAGNTVVLKSSLQGALCAAKFCECAQAAGVPPGVLHHLTGGSSTSWALLAKEAIDGFTFSGPQSIGMSMPVNRHVRRRYPKPTICWPSAPGASFVAASADLDAAAFEVARSAFGYSGQGNSACSRIYVAEEIAGAFTERLIDRVRGLVVGDPLDRDSDTGPVINGGAVRRFFEAVREAAPDGVIATGGQRCGGELGGRGHYVAPTIVLDLPRSHPLHHEERFLPLATTVRVADIDDAISLANKGPAGFTASIFAQDPADVRKLLAQLQASVVYVNRSAGTAAGVRRGADLFGGWKRSGSSGKAIGGPYYLAEFMWEQSQAVMWP